MEAPAIPVHEAHGNKKHSSKPTPAVNKNEIEDSQQSF